MKITTVLFDLDGTLLPMDLDVFMQKYFGLLSKKLAPYGFEPEKLIKTVWTGTKAMFKNNGEKTNEEVFWDYFISVYGDMAEKNRHLFDEFYAEDFGKLKSVCGFDPKAAEAVRELKSRGYRVVLATSPFFPSVATEARIRWVGLEPEEFELYTVYENSTACKPNPKYYLDILNKIGCEPNECIMVGNDVGDDMCAKELGMDVFLMPKCLINRENKDTSCYKQGDFDDLLEELKAND